MTYKKLEVSGTDQSVSAVVTGTTTHQDGPLLLLEVILGIGLKFHSLASKLTL